MALTLPPALVKRVLPAVLFAAVTVTATLLSLGEPEQHYLTLNPSLTQRFVSVPSESSLSDLCYRLRGVQGVTGVSYRNYSASERSALVTVFYDPRETSVRQLRIFVLHTRILWQQEMKA